MNNYHIINSAVLTSFGMWIYEPCSLTEAIDFIQMYNPRSTIRYEDTALALSFITGETITVRAKTLKCNPEMKRWFFGCVFRREHREFRKA